VDSLVSLGLLVVAAILAIPVLAIIAFVKAKAAERELAETHRRLREITAQLTTLSDAVRALQANASMPETPPPAAAGAAQQTRNAAADEFWRRGPQASPPASDAPPAPESSAAPPPAFPPPPPPPTPPSGPAPKLTRPAPPPPEKTASLEEALTSRWLVWLGAVAIALSGTFLVKYAIDNGVLGPGVRVTLGFVFGIVLTVAGEALRRRPLQREIAALRINSVPPALTASGIFVAFASIYAAYALYFLLPTIVAFVGLAFVALLAIGLSLLQGRLVAFIGLLGAFLTPALVVSPEPSAWALFLYLAVVEAACLVLARYKSWWWYALATLAGVTFWPLAWLTGMELQPGDVLPLGLFLLATATGFLYLCQSDWPARKSGWWSALTAPGGVAVLAAAVVAFVLFLVADQSHYSVAGLAFPALVSVLYMAAGRQNASFDSLPFVAAVMVLMIAANFPLGAVDGFLSPVPKAAPAQIQSYLWLCALFGALFAVLGFAFLWGAERPAKWAAVSAATPIALLVVAYYRLTGFNPDIAWAAIALGLSFAALFAAERVERYRTARGLEVSLGFYAAAVVALLSLAAAMTMREAWLTVALSLQLPALGLIAMRVNARALHVIVGLIACAVLSRLVLNYNVLDYPLSANPAFSWVVYGYGLPALSFLTAAHFFRKQKVEHLVALLESGALVFFVLLVSLLIRLFVTGSLATMRYGLLEQSLQSISWLFTGAALAVYHRRTHHNVAYYGSLVLLGVATAQVLLLQLLASNPLVTAENIGAYPMLNVLFLAYAVPALFAFGSAWYLTEKQYADFGKMVAIAGFVLLFAYVSLEVTRGFQGPRLSPHQRTAAELYTYSVVWLLYALVLLWLGIVRKASILRYASLAVVVVTIGKVFLSDMSGLTGLLRVFSFLGLGLSLVGIGYLYQRFVFRTPESKAKPPD
jgi:uncharacterized membrane protein